MKMFHLTIAEVGKTHWEGEAHSLTIKAADGEITILPEHQPLVTTTIPCNAIIYDEKEHRHDIALEHDGVLEVSNNQATVLL